MLWRPAEHEPPSGGDWDEHAAKRAISAIVADAQSHLGDCAWPTHPLDELEAEGPLTSLYLGSAGTIWALHELGSLLDLPPAIDLATVIGRALVRYRATPEFGDQAHPPSLWMGETGLLLVASKVGSPLADLDRLRELVRANRAHPTWELMWGSPGTMLAARACGFEDEWRDSAELLWRQWDETTDLWTQNLYGSVTTYLGPAHGFAGNVRALRGFVDDEILSARVARALDRHAIWREDLLNWPPRPTEPPETIRVQWCHGAPGIIATLGDLVPHESALAAGELIWRAGPLRKGPGLCHGTAGNGYAFLTLFARTGEERWLDRARRYAMHAIVQVERERDRLGRGRYSLWTGDLGVAIYLRSCIRGDPAFPTIDFW